MALQDNTTTLKFLNFQTPMITSGLFSKAQLRELAEGSSYERGLTYYRNGYVKNVVRRGNVFEGKVSGTSNYKVKLEVVGNELFFDCSCPYDYEGICKHCVALGLAVLDGKYATDSVSAPSGSMASNMAPADELFLTYFAKVDQASKNDFLLALLSRDANLRGQFLQFVYDQVAPASGKPSASTASVGAVRVDIDAVRDEAYRILTGMDFDDLDYDTYGRQYDRYVESWEQSQDIADDMIREVLSSYTQRAVAWVKQGDLLNGLRMMLGVYEAADKVTEPASDDYSIFDGLDYRDEVMRLFEEQLTEFTNSMKGVILAETVVRQVFDTLVERTLHYLASFDEHAEEAHVRIDWNVWNELLLTLLSQAALADYLYELLSKNQLLNHVTVPLVLRIAEWKKDDALWIDTAEKYLDSVPAVARPLLEKYQALDNWEAFLRAAKKMMKSRSHEFDQYLHNTLRYEQHPKLYVEALESLTRRTRNVAHYQELRQYLTDKQRNQFISENNNFYDPLFLVQMLAVEKRHEDILEVARKNKLTVGSNYDQLLAPILSVYPAECYELVVAKCGAELASGGRGRGSYQQIAGWLKALMTEKSLKEEVKAYVLHLYNSKPILPALRDEFKKAGLV
jgi:hypothetical protein